MKKFKTIKQANEEAKINSLKNKTTMYVIESNEFYYVDNDPFIRTWEKIHNIFNCGIQKFY